jgi:hypothetical protein
MSDRKPTLYEYAGERPALRRLPACPIILSSANACASTSSGGSKIAEEVSQPGADTSSDQPVPVWSWGPEGPPAD